MTRLTRKGESGLYAFILLLLMLLAILLSSCGPSYHLRKAERHIKKAEMKGAIVSRDTLWKTLEVPVPIIKRDTLVKINSFRDTITVKQDNIITKIKYDTISSILYLNTECKPDTVTIQVPIIVNKEIKSPRGFWYYFKFIAIALTVGFILGAIFWAALRACIKSFL